MKTPVRRPPGTAAPPPPAKKRELPLSKRFPDEYTHKTRICFPKRPPRSHELIFGSESRGGGSVEISGCLPDKVAELALWLILDGKRATDAELDAIIDVAGGVAKRIRADREAKAKAKAQG